LATFNLFRFPFDSQLLRAKLRVLDADKFAYREAFDNAHVSVTLPDRSSFDYDAIYRRQDWAVYDVNTIAYTDDPGVITFEIRVQRNSAGIIFKCVIPSVANAGIVVLSTTLKHGSRLKLLALSIVAASAMLNPLWLGLPDVVDGVPFVQSIVIIHMIITLLLLLYSGREAYLDLIYREVLRHHAEAHHGLLMKTKNQAIAAYKTMGEGVLTADIVWADKPTHLATPSHSLTTAVKRRALKAMTPAEKRGVSMESITVDGASEAPASPAAEVSAIQMDARDRTELDSVKAEAQPPASPQPEADGTNWLRKFTQLLYLLPVLFLQRDPTIPPGIWTPFETLNPFGDIGELQEYNQHLKRRKQQEIWLIWFTPIAFVVAWTIGILVYFASENPVDSA